MIPMPQAVYGLAQQPFDNLIATNGVRVLWRKSHQCPCSFSGNGLSAAGVQGSGRPSCQTCSGLGIYWDNPVGPLTALITFMNMNRSPDEPSAGLDDVSGPVLNASPSITVAQSINADVWANASIDDQFVEVDAPARFNAVLTQGVQNFVPFFQDLTIEPTGAVTTWDAVNNIVIPVTGYTATQNEVQTSLPIGTPFTVEFEATNIYLVFRKPGGQAHIRPFGMTLNQMLPRRFQARQIDRWIRARTLQADNVNGQTQVVSGASFPVVTTIGQL